MAAQVETLSPSLPLPSPSLHTFNGVRHRWRACLPLSSPLPLSPYTKWRAAQVENLDLVVSVSDYVPVYMRVTSCYITLYYNMGFAYMMMRRSAPAPLDRRQRSATETACQRPPLEISPFDRCLG